MEKEILYREYLLKKRMENSKLPRKRCELPNTKESSSSVKVDPSKYEGKREVQKERT